VVKMGKKVLSLTLVMVLILGSFSFAYGVTSLADNFAKNIFDETEGLTNEERLVLGDIVDTYVSLEDPGLVTGIVKQFIGDTRYENYDFILNFVDENNNYVIDSERDDIGGYIATDDGTSFRDSFDNWTGFDDDLREDMTKEEMDNYFLKFSISLAYLNEAKFDGTVAGYDSYMYEEDEIGDLTLIESIFDDGGMYDEARTFISKATNTTFPPTEEAKQAAIDLAERYNDSTQADKDIVFDFMVDYNLVVEYTEPTTPPSGGGGGGGGALPPAEEVVPFVIDIDYDLLTELIESSDEPEENRALLALSVNEGEETVAQVNISEKVLEETGYNKEIALAVNYNDITLILSGDSFAEIKDTQLSIVEEDNKYTFESDNDLEGPVYISLPYDGDSDYPSVFRYNEETEEYDLIGGIYDEDAGVVRFAVNSFSQYMVGEAEALEFTDIDEITWGQEYKDTVNNMSARGYIQGRGAEFDPFTEVTRAEFAAMLVRLLGMSGLQGEDIFDDVDAGDWFYEEVAAAYNAGLIEGVSETEFKPNDNITREEMAVMAARMLKLKYYLGSEVGATNFTDEEIISSWAMEGVAVVEELGIVEGRTSGEFDPKGLTTRLEAVIVMERLLAK
jgi:hypothetical protein